MSKDASVPDDLETAQRELLHSQLTHTESVLAETAVICEEQRARSRSCRANWSCSNGICSAAAASGLPKGPARATCSTNRRTKRLDPAPPSAAAEEEITYRRRRRGHGWGKLPEHLPREEVLIDVPESERTCPCCGEPLERIGEDRTERVDYRPATDRGEGAGAAEVRLQQKHGGVSRRKLRRRRCLAAGLISAWWPRWSPARRPTTFPSIVSKTFWPAAAWN